MDWIKGLWGDGCVNNCNKEPYLLIGDPISHSLSPQLFKSFFSSRGVEKVLLPLRVKREELEEAIPYFQGEGVRGFVVTMPHKESIIPFLDHLEEGVAQMGAVNTVYLQEGKWVGENTDGAALVTILKRRRDLRGSRVFLIGGGGVARSIVYHLIKGGAEVTLFNRNLSNLLKLKEIYPSLKMAPLSKIEEYGANYDVLIQATSVGMGSDEMVIAPHLLSPGKLLVDVVYSPRKTRFLVEGEKRGCQILGGLEMFIEQARLQLQFFLSTKIQQEQMAAILDVDSNTLEERWFALV